MTVVLLTTERAEVQILPDLGGKISRLFDVERGREWLVPTPADAKRAAPGSSFVEAGLSGWDEMLPTVLPCSYPGRGTYSGAALGDHGDAWTAPWEVTELGRRSATMFCELPSLPLRLERRARVSGARLRLEYELAATDSGPVSALWAAHPLFVCAESTRVALPGEVSEVLDVIDVRNRAPVPWPGEIDRIAALPPATGRKLYVAPEQKLRSARLVDGDGTSLEMAWDPALCPYLGLWLDNGWLSDGPVAALEPAIAFCDELALAAELGTAVQVGPAPVHWWLEITLR